MPAKSKAQQRYFGYLLSNKDEREKEGVSRKVAREFAGTKHKGLPEKVKEGIDGSVIDYFRNREITSLIEDAPTMSTGSDPAGFSNDADNNGPVAGLDQPLGLSLIHI